MRGRPSLFLYRIFWEEEIVYFIREEEESDRPSSSLPLAPPPDCFFLAPKEKGTSSAKSISSSYSKSLPLLQKFKTFWPPNMLLRSCEREKLKKKRKDCKRKQKLVRFSKEYFIILISQNYQCFRNSKKILELVIF